MGYLSRRDFVGTSAALVFPPEINHWIDTHTHFYNPERKEGVPWPGKDDKVLYRKVMPEEFEKLAKPLGIRDTVVVEASPWVEDNQWLLDLAMGNSYLPGIIGNLDLLSADFASHLKRFAKEKKFLGFRVNENSLLKAMGEATGKKALQTLVDSGLRLEVNGGPSTPGTVAKLATIYPQLPIMINHAGNVPNQGKDLPREWEEGMAAAAKGKKVFCKVSGLVESAKGKKEETSQPQFYFPLLNRLWNYFSPERLVFGSNWPVSARAASLGKIIEIVDGFLQGKKGLEAQRIRTESAREFYGL